jgi:arginine/serine-rich splicing factor 1/9
LQDHFRQYVKPAFTDVYRDRGEAVGVAEFETMDDMLYAIKKLDDTEFKNPFEKSYIRLIEVSAFVLFILLPACAVRIFQTDEGLINCP